MNYNEAAILLGVEPGTPADAARKEYVARARILHPDRYAGAPAADIQAASNAMAQLNEAWEVYQQGPSAATSGTSRGYTSTPNPEPDFPIYSGTDICEMCGWGPARQVKFNNVQGVIIWWRWGTIDARLCQLCGIAAYNEAQRSSLTRGWWGIIAPIATLIAFIGNMSRVGTIKSLPRPQGRSPHAITLLPIPMIFTTPWYKRPLAWVSTAIAFTIVAWFTLGAIAGTSRTPGTTGNASSGQTVQDEREQLVAELSAQIDDDSLTPVQMSCIRTGLRGFTVEDLRIMVTAQTDAEVPEALQNRVVDLLVDCLSN